MTMEMTKGSAPNAVAEAKAVEAPQYIPAVDVYETADEFVVQAEMPGCDPKGIEVQVENGELSIRGHVAPRQAPAAGWLAREFGVGDFHRTFNVTESIQTDRISAEYEHGILTLRLPKIEQARPRRIEVRGK